VSKANVVPLEANGVGLGDKEAIFYRPGDRQGAVLIYFTTCLRRRIIMGGKQKNGLSARSCVFLCKLRVVLIPADKKTAFDSRHFEGQHFFPFSKVLLLKIGEIIFEVFEPAVCRYNNGRIMNFAVFTAVSLQRLI